MDILLDTCIWNGVQKELQIEGHDVIWIGNMAKDPGDTAIISRGFAESRILITLDKDFGELAILRRFPHYGIIRLVNCAGQKQGRLATSILKRYPEELIHCAIITAEPGRVRIRPGNN